MGRPPLKIGIEERFWSKVEIGGPDDCWEWKAGKVPDGYGMFSPAKSRQILSHRMAYMIAHGAIPVGLWILHACDNRSCVNPSHLFAGTVVDNNRDKHEKGRDARGEFNGASTHPAKRRVGTLHGAAVLNEWQVIQAVARLLMNDSLNRIARDLGVSDGTIRRIMRGWNWKHLFTAPLDD